MQAENDDDLDGGQRSSEVKWGKLCAMHRLIKTQIGHARDFT